MSIQISKEAGIQSVPNIPKTKAFGVNRIAMAQQLLDEAIVAAIKATSPKPQLPALTCTRWVWRLAGAYHTSRFTSSLMEKAAQKFALAGRHNLAQWAAQKAIEERGHDRLALLDIQSMGYEATAVVKALVPSAATSFVDYFTQTVEASNPIGCVGLAYMSERPGTFIKEEYIQSIEALLPPGINATRWLRVHSSVGPEVQHVKDTVELVSELTAEERTCVARTCYETALLRFSPPKDGYLSDAELEHMIKPLKVSHAPVPKI